MQVKLFNKSVEYKNLQNNFKNYLEKKYPSKKESTINTIKSDAFYSVRHPEIMTFEEIFCSKENFLLYSDLFAIDYVERGKKTEGIWAYKNAFNELFSFLKENKLTFTDKEKKTVTINKETLRRLTKYNKIVRDTKAVRALKKNMIISAKFVH